jgi:hypothetical protein
MSKKNPTEKEVFMREAQERKLTLDNLKMSAEYHKYNYEIMYYTLEGEKLKDAYSKHLEGLMSSYIQENNLEVFESSDVTPIINSDEMVLSSDDIVSSSDVDPLV